jgi:hypothetical protein
MERPKQRRTRVLTDWPGQHVASPTLHCPEQCRIWMQNTDSWHRGANRASNAARSRGRSLGRISPTNGEPPNGNSVVVDERLGGQQLLAPHRATRSRRSPHTAARPQTARRVCRDQHEHHAGQRGRQITPRLAPPPRPAQAATARRHSGHHLHPHRQRPDPRATCPSAAAWQPHSVAHATATTRSMSRAAPAHACLFRYRDRRITGPRNALSPIATAEPARQWCSTALHGVQPVASCPVPPPLVL